MTGTVMMTTIMTTIRMTVVMTMTITMTTMMMMMMTMLELTLLRRGRPRLDANLDSVQPNELYSGAENPVKILIERRIQFSCSFDNIKNFPFGRQRCSLHFQLVRASNLIKTTVNEEASVVGQYIINAWSVGEEFNLKTGRNMTKITMVLTRKFTSIFMVTYLPTCLMNMINQATNFITGEDKYSMIYTINITCMMVLTSIYLSVSASLPVTVDIKPVEIWLLFNLSYPFITILVNVLLQVLVYKSINAMNSLTSQGLENRAKTGRRHY